MRCLLPTFLLLGAAHEAGSLKFVSPSGTPWNIVEIFQNMFATEPLRLQDQNQRQLRDFPRCGQPPVDSESGSAAATRQKQPQRHQRIRNQAGSNSGQDWTSGSCKPDAVCNIGQGDCNNDWDCYRGFDESICGNGNCQEFSSDAPSWADCCRPRIDSDPRPLTTTQKIESAAYWRNIYDTNPDVESVSFISDKFGTNSTYQVNTIQTWTVSNLPNGNDSLLLHFPFFDVEQSYRPGCTFDNVTIFDGGSDTPLGTYCGTGTAIWE